MNLHLPPVTPEAPHTPRPDPRARPERDYVPPPPWGALRATDPLPRNDLKDQDAHRHGIRLPPAVRLPGPSAPPPAAAAAVAPLPRARSRRTRVQSRRTPVAAAGPEAARGIILRRLEALPDGDALITADLAAAVGLSLRSTSQTLNRLRATRPIEARHLRRREAGHAGDYHTTRQWRLSSALPWPAPPKAGTSRARAPGVAGVAGVAMSDCRLHTPVPAELASVLKGLTREHLEQVIAKLSARLFLPRDDLERAIREARREWHWRRYDQAMEEIKATTLGPAGERARDRSARYDRLYRLWAESDHHVSQADKLWFHHQPHAEATP